MKKFRKEKFIKSKKNSWFFRIIWLVFLCLISVLLARYIITGINDMLAVGRKQEVVQVEIPKGASLDTVAKIFKEEGIISEPLFFKLYAVATKSTKGFSQGIYELNTSMDYQAILNHTRNQANSKDVVEVTFTEGMNILEYADLLHENGVCDKSEFLASCNSDEFDEKYSFIKEISNKGEREYKLEGYLFPDTYQFYRGESASDSIFKFLSNFQKKIIKRGKIEGYDKSTSIKELAEEKNMNLENLINIASLIQAEAANKSDMYKVSSAIQNRLATVSNGGKSKFGEFTLNILRIDATIFYPYKNKVSVPVNIAHTFQSSYDTYKIEGLPPGPICNPGMDAILAALNPESTDYYYYCHSASGEAFYAKTMDAHLANQRKAGIL